MSLHLPGCRSPAERLYVLSTLAVASPPTLRDMTILDTAIDTPVGGPSLPQERRLVTPIPGPESRKRQERKSQAPRSRSALAEMSFLLS